MDIRYINLEHGITTDAPFIGSRICAIACHNHCPGCFNENLKAQPIQTISAWDIIYRIQEHPLSQGIIFGGLEWTEQPLELQELVEFALVVGLQVMIYTHYPLVDFLARFPNFKNRPIYVKCGEYKQELKGYYDEEHNVILASSNQKIYYLKNI